MESDLLSFHIYCFRYIFENTVVIDTNQSHYMHTLEILRNIFLGFLNISFQRKF